MCYYAQCASDVAIGSGACTPAGLDSGGAGQGRHPRTAYSVRQLARCLIVYSCSSSCRPRPRPPPPVHRSPTYAAAWGWTRWRLGRWVGPGRDGKGRGRGGGCGSAELGRAQRGCCVCRRGQGAGVRGVVGAGRLGPPPPARPVGVRYCRVHLPVHSQLCPPPFLPPLPVAAAHSHDSPTHPPTQPHHPRPTPHPIPPPHPQVVRIQAAHALFNAMDAGDGRINGCVDVQDMQVSHVWGWVGRGRGAYWHTRMHPTRLHCSRLVFATTGGWCLPRRGSCSRTHALHTQCIDGHGNACLPPACMHVGGRLNWGYGGPSLHASLASRVRHAFSAPPPSPPPGASH